MHPAWPACYCWLYLGCGLVTSTSCARQPAEITVFENRERCSIAATGGLRWRRPMQGSGASLRAIPNSASGNSAFKRRRPRAMEALSSSPDPATEGTARAARHAARTGREYLLSDYAGAESISPGAGAWKGLKQPVLDAESSCGGARLVRQCDSPRMAGGKFSQRSQNRGGDGPAAPRSGGDGEPGIPVPEFVPLRRRDLLAQSGARRSEKLGLADRWRGPLGNLGWCYHRLGAPRSRRSVHARSRSALPCVGYTTLTNSRRWTGTSGDVLLDEDDLPAAAKTIHRGARDRSRRARTIIGRGTWLSNLAIRWTIDTKTSNAADRITRKALRVKKNLPGGFDFQARVNRARIIVGRHAERQSISTAQRSSHTVTARGGLRRIRPRFSMQNPDSPNAHQARLTRREPTGQFRSALYVDRAAAGPPLAAQRYKLSVLFRVLYPFYQDTLKFSGL